MLNLTSLFSWLFPLIPRCLNLFTKHQDKKAILTSPLSLSLLAVVAVKQSATLDSDCALTKQVQCLAQKNKTYCISSHSPFFFIQRSLPFLCLRQLLSIIYLWNASFFIDHRLTWTTFTSNWCWISTAMIFFLFHSPFNCMSGSCHKRTLYLK